MTHTIGEMAGQVWDALEGGNEMTLAKLKTQLKADAFVLNAAIGWLAREGKIDISKKGTSVKVRLAG